VVMDGSNIRTLGPKSGALDFPGSAGLAGKTTWPVISKTAVSKMNDIVLTSRLRMIFPAA